MPFIQPISKLERARQAADSYLIDLENQLLTIIQESYQNAKRHPSSPFVKGSRTPEKEENYPIFSRLDKEYRAEVPFVTFPTAAELKDQIIKHLNTVSTTYKRSDRFVQFGQLDLFNNGYSMNYFNDEIKNIAQTKNNPAENKKYVNTLNYDLAESGLTYLRADPDNGPKVTRLIKRLEAVKELKVALTNAHDDEAANEAVNKALTVCKQNQPTWSERPFLQKLADVFTLGATYFFSKNSNERFIKTIAEEQPDGAPKPGK